MAVHRLHTRHRAGRGAGPARRRTSSAAVSTSVCTSTSGAGAFVCGEGSGPDRVHRGQPRHAARQSPRAPSSKGLCGRAHRASTTLRRLPTSPLIIKNGADWYHSPSAPRSSSGTKAFALTGNVVNTGLIEVPMGTTHARGRLRHRRRHPRRQESSRPCRSAARPAAA